MWTDTPERVERAIEQAVADERKRCVAIVQAARFGEIDGDWRSVIHRIEMGDTLEELKRADNT